MFHRTITHLNRSHARLLAGVAILALPAVRCTADMGGFNSDKTTAAEVQQQPTTDNGPSLSEAISGQFEVLKPLVDAKQWDQALALVGQMAATVDSRTYQGGYDMAMILDTKAKILVESDHMTEAIAPWEGMLALAKKHPSYFYKQQISDIVHYLAQIYSQDATNIKLTPGPDLEERTALQLKDFQKAVAYLKQWMAGNVHVTPDDQLSYAETLYNLASITAGDDGKKLLVDAQDAAEKGLRMSTHPHNDLYYLMVLIAGQEGDMVTAAHYLEILAEHKPESKIYWPQLMLIYSNLGATSKQAEVSRNYYLRAIYAIERAQAHGVLTDQKTNLNLVTIYYDLGQFGRATELLSKGLKDGGIDPAQANWQILAYCYEQINEYVQAIDTYKDAEKLYPDNGSLDFSIARIYSQLEDLPNAYQYLVSAAHKSNVTSPYGLYVSTAYTAYELEKYDEALKACDQAAKYPEAATDSELPQLREAIQEKINDLAKPKPAGATS